MLNRDYHRSAAPVILTKEAAFVAAVVTCITDGCGSSETWRITSRVPPPEILKKHFERKGWQLRRGPLCELCQAKKRKPTMATNQTLTAPPAKAKPALEVPKTALAAAMTTAAASNDARKALRMTIQFLEDYFDDGRGSYKPGWSDARIAEETGASPDAVKAERERLFGPLREPDELRELRLELSAVREQASAIATRIDRLCQRNGWAA